ncbi:Uncharacterised protein [Salmonella enterica]|nr:Uncharacterised protein [Salmonella enterica]
MVIEENVLNRFSYQQKGASSFLSKKGLYYQIDR